MPAKQPTPIAKMNTAQLIREINKQFSCMPYGGMMSRTSPVALECTAVRALIEIAERLTDLREVLEGVAARADIDAAELRRYRQGAHAVADLFALVTESIRPAA